MTIPAATAARWLSDGAEVAMLDVREAVPHGFGHPLAATNAPLSRLELMAYSLVPRHDVRLLLFDDDDARSTLAANRLSAMDYSHVHAIEGGSDGWLAAGQTLFPEQQAYSKGFGAFAALWGRPELISPNDLAAARDRGQPLIMLDARPPAEYQRGNIPGSIDAPGPDMLWSFDDLVPEPNATVVVNCMSRTRGTLGALTLRAAGVPNPVKVLHDGTRNWLLEGFTLERDARRFAGPPGRAARLSAVNRARALARKARLVTLDRKALDAWRNDQERTTYVIDVRSPQEYASGHLPDVRNVPHGGLYMHPDHDIATLNARVVLVDDDGVRATVNALWLSHMGWECAMYHLDPKADRLTDAPWSPPVPPTHNVSYVEADTLMAKPAAERPPIVDVDTSASFENIHVEGALWCDRPRLDAFAQARFDEIDEMVVTCRDGTLARFAAADAAPLSGSRRRVMAGGNAAWRAAGGAMASGTRGIELSRDDNWLLSSERPGDQRHNVMAYLEWENTLAQAIDAAGWVPYRNLLWS